MFLRQLKREMRKLSLGQLGQLDEWLHCLLHEVAERPKSKAAGRVPVSKQTVEERGASGKTYRLEGIKCGKEKCKCAAGKLHGPYWYCYFSVNGKTKSEYIGKELPAGVLPSAMGSREVRMVKNRKKSTR